MTASPAQRFVAVAAFATAMSAHALPFKDRPATGGPTLAEGASVVERLGDRIPLQLGFTDSRGRRVSLAQVTQGRPTVLVLAYARCPTLCSLVLAGTARSLRQTGLQLGRDVNAVTVSIDPAERPEEAGERRRGYLQAMNLSDQSDEWPFLVGDERSIRALADAVGFGYRYDDQLKQFVHAAVMVVLAPDGRISRYWYGLDHPPRDLRLSLVEASAGRVGTAMDRALLTCIQYDPALRRYGWAATAIIKGGALLVFGALATLMGALWRRELRRSKRGVPP